MGGALLLTLPSAICAYHPSVAIVINFCGKG